MAAQALYRRWRSRTFEEVVGQEHVTRTLQNALRGGLVAHAYLFAGPRGTGKTSTARLLAKAVNCTAPEEERPCNRCSICRAIDEGRLMDLIEIDAASNRGIDEIRELRERVGFRPSEASYKVYVIDEVHMLTNEAFNALLKTLEEPPPHVIFVLATTEPHKIPATVLSRCQWFDFRRIPLAAMLERLTYVAAQEGLSVEAEALDFVARQATGSLRDALSLLDQLTAYSGQTITLDQVQTVLGTVSSQAVGKLVDLLIEGDAAGGLVFINQLTGDGIDPRQFNREVVEYLHGLLLVKTVGNTSLLNVPGETSQAMSAQAARLSTRQLLRQVKLFNQASLDLRRNWQGQLPLELAFVEATLSDETQNEPPGGPQPDAIPTASAPGVDSALQPSSAPPPPGPSEKMRPAGTKTKAGQPSSGGAPAKTPATPSAPSTPGALTLEGLRLNWARIMQEMRTGNHRTVEALLRGSCEPVDVEGQVVVIGFYHGFHKERMSEDKHRSLLERVIGQVMGCSCQVRCVDKPQEETAQKPAPTPQASVTKSPEPSDSALPKDKDTSWVNEDYLIQETVKRYKAVVTDVQPKND